MTSKSFASLRETAAERLERYTSPTGLYAFRTYDVQGDVDAPLMPSDILMANLLSLKLGWKDVIPLFAEGDGPEQRLRIALDAALGALRDAKPFESFETNESLETAVSTLAEANAATETVENWTPVTVSKVLHRRRAHIVPLNDSRVREFYSVRPTQSKLLRKALWEDINENVDWLNDLAGSKTTPDGRPLSLLRLADILIWMSYATSQ